MDMEVGELTGTAHGERSPDRLVQRDGYRDGNWQTWAGTADLQIPSRRSARAGSLGTRRLSAPP